MHGQQDIKSLLILKNLHFVKVSSQVALFSVCYFSLKRRVFHIVIYLANICSSQNTFDPVKQLCTRFHVKCLIGILVLKKKISSVFGKF